MSRLALALLVLAILLPSAALGQEERPLCPRDLVLNFFEELRQVVPD